MLQAAGDTEGMKKNFGFTATEFASRHDYVIDTADLLFDSCCRSVVEAVIDVSLAVIARTAGLNVPTPKAPALIAASQPKRKHLTFDEIAEDILENAVPAVGLSTKEGARTALRFFRKIYGTVAPEDITRLMVTEWIRLLAKRPSRPPPPIEQPRCRCWLSSTKTAPTFPRCPSKLYRSM
jgi:hypothetical protein